MKANLAERLTPVHSSIPRRGPAVFLMENHDEAYYRWREAGVRDKILVHIDAHHDMWWKPDNTGANIANFVCPGLQENIVRELFWVIPDRTWELEAGRKALSRHLQEIVGKYPGSKPATETSSRRISTTVLGKPLTICSLDGLPELTDE